MDKKAPLSAKDGSIYFEILVDRNTIEIFCNHGEVYMPIARDLSKEYGLELISDSGTTVAKSLQIFELESIWN
jgi:sucrose-6-phosphate hydrolase SacC (GH32 family)